MLTLDHLSVLNTYLHGVSTKWHAFGLQLGFTSEMLVNLAPANCDSAVHLSKLLSTWLQRPHSPTLDELCNALSHVTVGEEKLAEWLLHRKFKMR